VHLYEDRFGWLHSGGAAGALQDKTLLLCNHKVVATCARVAAAFNTLIMLPAVERMVK